MRTIPLLPETAPFTPEQRAWLNGFFAGIFSRAPAAASPSGSPTAALPALQPLTILFGSQTGTAESLAKKAAKAAGKRGFAATAVDMAQTDAARLTNEKNLLVITSTYGDGEPPDNARTLHAAIRAADAPTLPNVRFAVCALGDTNYRLVCQCGKDFDAALEKLGALRIAPRADCDLDYDQKFETWLDLALSAFGAPADAAPRSSDEKNHPEGKAVATNAEPAFSRKNPFPASVLAVRNLSAAGSAKEVNHIEFSLENSALLYEPGDALGVLPQNCPSLVDDVLAALGCDGEEAVQTAAGELPLRSALTSHYDLGKPSAELIEMAGAAAPREQRAEVGESRSSATAVAGAPHHVIDVLLGSPGLKIPPAAFVAALKKMQPRLYSISSSLKAHPGQVHLTVGALRYEKDGRARKGLCSTFLAERAVAAGKIGVFIHANTAFRLPPSGTPMIMVGPGTGVAPFRAFLGERRAAGAKGRNWLFFGDQRATTDFLYRDELQTLQREGTLTRLDLAFSRDQAEKIYVQHRMLEHAADLYAWLEDGAHFYVCGDASRMARDVDAALHAVVERAGGKTPEAAAEYVQKLRAAKRYHRDVY